MSTQRVQTFIKFNLPITGYALFSIVNGAISLLRTRISSRLPIMHYLATLKEVERSMNVDMDYVQNVFDGFLC